MVGWSHEETFQFIETYRNEPKIWNLGNKYHKEKSKIYTCIDDGLGMTSFEEENKYTIQNVMGMEGEIFSTASYKSKKSKVKNKGKKISKLKNEDATEDNEVPDSDMELEYKFFAKTPTDASAKKGEVEGGHGNISEIDILNVELAEMESPISSLIINKEIYDRNILQILSLVKPQGNLFVKFISFFRESFSILGRMALKLSNAETSDDWFDEDGNLQILQMKSQVLFTNTEASTATVPLKVVHVDPFFHRGLGLSLIKGSSELLSVLELDCGSLKFEHHPLFSIEHVLAQKLVDCYNQYTLQKTQIDLDKTDEQLKHLNNTLDKLKSDLLESKNNLKHIYNDPLVQKYHNKISVIRDLRLKEAKQAKEITFMILHLWRDIKFVREKMKFINSPVVLQITKVERNQDDNDKLWQEQFQLELKNTVRDLEFDYMKRRLEFKNKMESYKENTSSNIIAEKPVKPKLLYDKAELHKKVTMVLREILPSEPEVEFELNFDKEILSRSIADTKEIDRRNNVIKTKLSLVILLDNIIVCKSDMLNLNNSFTIHFNKKIAVQTVSKNKTVKFQFMQNDTILHEEMFCLPDRNENITSVQTRESVFISKQVVERKKYAVGSGFKLSAALGFKPVKHLNSAQYFHNCLLTKGKFNFRIGWSVPPESMNTTPNLPEFNYDSTCIGCIPYYNDNAVVDFDSIRSLIKAVTSNEDEVVEYNSKLSAFQTILESVQIPTDLSGDTFTNIDKTDPRLLLLKLRKEQKLNSIKNKRIPLDSREISTGLLAIMKEEMNEEKYDLETSLGRMGGIEPLDLQRYTSSKYLKSVYEYITHNVNETALKRHQQDLIMDFQIPNIRSLLSPAILKPRRPLMYSRQNLHPLHGESQHHRHNLGITLVRAFRLPERLTEDTATASQNRLSIQSPDAFKITSLRPLVRVSCQDSSTQSNSAVGCNPTWNQTLNLPIRCDLPSYININLYDEVREELNSGESGVSTVHYRLGSRWLAGLRVPLTTVLSNSVIEGTFKMNSPPTIFGYEYMADRDIELISPTTSNMEDSSPMTKDNIYITLYINVNPPCPLNLRHFSTTLESGDIEYIEKHLKKYANDFTRQFPDRQIQTTFIDSSGKSKCVTRFLQPLPPPDLEKITIGIQTAESAMSKSSGSSQTRKEWKRPSDGSEKSSDIQSITNERDSVSNMFEMKNLRSEDNNLENIMQKCARYVSLIPIYEHGHAGSVALRGLELLKLMCGSPLDQTILLTSYFLYLGLKCWILVGRGSPRAYGSFVLIRINRRTNRVSLTTDSNVPPKSMLLRGSFQSMPWRYVVYDATTGHRYDLRDIFNPLRKVYFAFNEENIWANVQQSDCCETMRFDLANSSDWQPTFDKNLSLCKLPACHDLPYREPIPVDTLKSRIEEKVKSKIEKWRSHRRTIWNRYCSSVLQENLQHWEAWTLNALQPKPEPSRRLKLLTVSYNVFGFPLNFPYTNIKTILFSIKGTALCMNDDSGVEFALAVEVFSYPNDVISVWLYLATITRKT